MIHTILRYLFGFPEPALAPPLPIPCGLRIDDEFGYVRDKDRLKWLAGERAFNPETMTQQAQLLTQAYQDLIRFKYSPLFISYQALISVIGRITDATAWADDDIIYQFMCSLTRKYSAVQKIAVVHSLDLSDGVWRQKYIDFTGIYQNEKERLKEADLILIPIHSDSHWHIMAIQKNENYDYTVYFADGFNSKTSHAIYFNRAWELLALLYPDIDLIVDRKSILLPRQNNGLDCGYIACAIADRLAKGPTGLAQLQSYSNLATQSCDYSATRRLVIERLVEYTQQLVAECQPETASDLILSKRLAPELPIAASSSSSSSPNDDAEPTAKRHCVFR